MNFMKYKHRVTKDLDEIAKELKAGGKYEDYSEDLDRLLGTGMVERDFEVEEIFENNKEVNNDG